jgi:hypothetical protein
MPRVYAMATNRDSPAYTRFALESFFRHTPWESGDEFLLIDNNGDPELAAHQARWPVRPVVNAEPFSFAENVNQAIDAADRLGAEVFFLNNDIIFTPDWLPPLLVPNPVVITPTCNQNFQYQGPGLKLEPVMTLDQYVGHEEELLALVAEHRRQRQGYVIAYKTNFFAFKVPPAVYRAVGKFDTSFSPIGGEDDDYSLRTYLHGFSVVVAQQSYLLHFGGRSTWSGPESLDQAMARERSFIAVFQRKWGPRLARFLLYRDPSILREHPELQQIEQLQGIAGLFRAIAAMDGRRLEPEGGMS